MRPMASTSMSTTGQSTATSSVCARNSRTSIRILRRSKHSMASGIDTATVESAAAPASPSAAAEHPSAPRSAARAAPILGPNADLRPRSGRRWKVSPLTRRILAVNVLALALLAGGVFFLGQYQASLIGQQIEALKTQGEVFAAALGEGAVLDSVDEGEVLLPDLARQMMRRVGRPRRPRPPLCCRRGG